MIPRIRIAHLPTPVEPLPRLSTILGGPRLWVKRDDQTGLALGGNKTRKLEFVVAEAQAHGAQTLITVGAVQSNHCRQTAALAARLGLECALVLFGESPKNPSGNYLLDRLFGAEVTWATRETYEAVLQETFEKAWAEGRRPYLIPLGASTPLGAIAYAYAFKEFAEQGIEADWIVLASSSAGTQAGLVLGARLSGWRGRILGISVDHPAGWVKERVAELASQAADRLGESVRIAPHEVEVNDSYIGAGYGVMGHREVEAIQLFARHEGLLLDPVYTGRAAAGMIDLIRSGFFKPGERVLFWHTGGIPALFADRYAPNLL
ncbi:pyridoxal-5'-phosphate-dependent protein [Thermanaerothrix daxensis]|uniref:Pyridoxal-5'-phosphate-dependent protein n=1 Tax=Thermanaerothrix daxensis TaxID=869279 RepID=A0A0P6Y667_9CHLR|nr:D-cysteine desulfhydrase family protein [Thermanaerothrix daxensis]KPL84431.1 pyridoxal-5'-phosphate-dependent protein [Thermanaerothrix daxensis]